MIRSSRRAGAATRTPGPPASLALLARFVIAEQAASAVTAATVTALTAGALATARATGTAGTAAAVVAPATVVTAATAVTAGALAAAGATCTAVTTGTAAADRFVHHIIDVAVVVLELEQPDPVAVEACGRAPSGGCRMI